VELGTFTPINEVNNMTTQVAFLFPGQGSQKVGMGADVFATSEAARRVFAVFNDALGFSLSDLCFQGPGESLCSTVNAQPAIVAVSLAYLAALQEALTPPDASQLSPLVPSYTAGHSVGECTSLFTAGALDLVSTAHLVRERGLVMHEEEEACPGGMAAIIGMDINELRQICQEATQQCQAAQKTPSQHPGSGQVVLANYNAPGQIVISGEEQALALASSLAKERGAKRVIPLSVSGAFHSPVMQPAIERLGTALANMHLQDAAYPIISNITARPLTNATELRKELAQQVAESVQWIGIIEYLASQGTNVFFEIGPGQALAGMIKRIIKGATIINIGSIADIEKAKGQIQELGLFS
jgi:[acyl-carrier-protein] S-malonyltransferase